MAHSNETKRKISKSRLERKAKLGYLNSSKTRKKLSIAASKKSGEKASNWRGGITKNIPSEIKKQRILKSILWNKNNRKRRNEIQRVYNRKRYAFLRGCNGVFTSEEWEIKKKEYGYLCAICSVSEIDLINKTGMGLTVDHKIPITKWIEFTKTNKLGYQCNDIKNIQPLCRSCNCQKLNKIYG